MTITASEFDYIRRLVLEQSAIVLEEDKQYLAEVPVVTLGAPGRVRLPCFPGRLFADEDIRRPSPQSGGGDDHQ